MKAVHLKLPPNAKFHLGEYTEDKATVLYNTSQIIHSDVLFGAFISALSQVSLEKVEVFKEYFESGKLAFSSAFYVLNIKGKEEQVYLLPKPISLNLFQSADVERFQVKKFKKIEFISKGIWEKGVSPEKWFDSDGECVMPNSKTVCLRSEIGNEKFDLFQESDEEKVNLTPLGEDNELYTRTNLEILGTDRVKVDFYFLMQEENLPKEDSDLVKIIWKQVTLNGIGGERSTGCGAVEGIKYEDFSINVQEKSDKNVLLGLAFPESLDGYLYYQTKVRGGMNYGEKKKIKLLMSIQEGAVISKQEKARIVDLSQGNKKYWKYSSNLVLPFHKNHDL